MPQYFTRQRCSHGPVARAGVRLAEVLAWSFLAATAQATDAVQIVKQPQNYVVHTDVYTATVDSSGVLSSLVIEGSEFIAAPTVVTSVRPASVVPGLFAAAPYALSPLKPPGVRELRDTTIHCEGNGWKLDYTFLPDAIDLAYEGVPEGGRGFKAGYPATDLTLSLAHDLDRACDPGNQGELGWPVQRKYEPGNLAVLAKNGAGLIAENATCLRAAGDLGSIPAPPHRLDLLVFDTLEKGPGPVRHRLELFRKADLAHSVTLKIQSPNRQNLFSGTGKVEFAVEVHTLYGRKLSGAVVFSGAPYVWKTPLVTATTPAEVGVDGTATVQLNICPPKPGHYTGLISITDGHQAICSQRVGFIFRPEEIPPVVAPPGFDEFWDKTLSELEKVPLDLTLEEQKDMETPSGRLYKAKFWSWGGRWAWAWLNVPKAEGKFPGTVVCPPVSVFQPGRATPADGTLHIAAAVHGGDLKDYPAKPDFDYMNTGIADRDTYMLRYSYCCLVRCFDILKHHENCNGEVDVKGGSQGGGLSLVLAGLRSPRSVQGRAIALCRIDWTILGYTQWGPRCPAGADPARIAEVVRYFDPACFAHRIHAPLKLAFGLFDFCAPAEGIFTALNALPRQTPCQVFVDPYGGHFTLDTREFDRNVGMIDIPRWQGTDADNKLNR